MGEPPDVAAGTLGMLFPSNIDPLDNGWGINITFVSDGFVKDDAASSLHYSQIMDDMKKSATEESQRREKEGYHGFEIIGWAAPPHYDHDTHKLYWAKELQFKGDPQRTLNYDIRVPGRRGVLPFNAIASKSELASVSTAMPEVLQSVNFNQGHRYTDFIPSRDKVAVYGIGALIAGKIALKVGMLKWIVAFIIAGKKFIFLALAGFAGFLRSYSERKRLLRSRFWRTAGSGEHADLITETKASLPNA